MIVKPQIINPFIGIFSSDKLFANQLDIKLNMLNPNIIINLSKISQKEFIEPTDYKTINNTSFVEVNEAKKLIIENRIELNSVISYLFDSNIEYFKQILLTLETNPSGLPKTMKNIDDVRNNFAMLYYVSKLLNLDFTHKGDGIGYMLNKKILSIFTALPSDEEYQAFNSKENQTKLKNILSLINLDSELHLQEIKQAIDYDIIISGTAKSTSIIYSIILLLCIFSLQKTARKNSIIPS